MTTRPLTESDADVNGEELECHAAFSLQDSFLEGHCGNMAETVLILTPEEKERTRSLDLEVPICKECQKRINNLRTLE